jgi:hypothetical protein
MPTRTTFLTEGDDEDTPMSNVVSLFGPDEPMLLGDIIAGIILPDLAVRMRGDFHLPRLAVSRSLGRESETD